MRRRGSLGAMVFHIVKRDEWDATIARGAYAPASIDAEGFIHCSSAAQLLDTANLYYRGQRDLVVLCIDERALASPLKFEAPASSSGAARAGTKFPHLYGKLNLDAVTRVVDFPCAADGSFAMPAALSE